MRRKGLLALPLLLTLGVGTFTTDISGLDGVSQYYYRIYAQDSASGVWTDLGTLPPPIAGLYWWHLY